ncbi:MAG: glycerol-3-phosphate acyltransferase [Halioglobus sp.]|nr:glycerol-3-phosphate acyltransferase [Halioglobus sp.]|tara:strand:+ start:533 stop:2827 length:2295 start_codon:yes stop_codon:yes gene_type:complete
MSVSPWPGRDDAPVVFIVDAAHRVDEGLLMDWLRDHNPRPERAPESVVVPIVRDPENIPSAALLPVLDLPDATLLVPLRVVWKTSIAAKTGAPRLRDLLWGNPRRPNIARARRVLRKHPERAQKIAAAAATLGELKERYRQRRAQEPTDRQLADYIAAQAGLALDVAERKLRGSRYKVPRQVARNLQARPAFRSALAQISQETGRPLEDLQRESAEIMKELVSIPQTFWIDVMGAFNRYLINLGYETDMVIDRAALDRVRQITREHPSALLWTHKTHVDGFAIHSTLLENDFPAPHILGGVNMAFGGLGFLARRAGAIFIRRSFQDNPLYKMILRQYLGYLLEKRFPLTWAFEGTRSRVGKLMPPRYGLLKYVVEAAHNSGAENLHIVPVAINYDLIGDVGDYATEQAGASKQPESLKWFIGYLRGLRQPMGRIYVDIGEPVVLPRAPDPQDARALQKIAFQVGVEVNKVTPITLASLSAMILLGAAPRALTEQELRAEMQAYIDWARQRDIPFTATSDLGNDEQLRTLARQMIANGLVTRYDGGPERVYALKPEQHGIASYYRNTTIHHFVNKAIAELALMAVASQPGGGAAAFWEEAESLRDLYKFEFFYAPTDEFRDQVRTELCRYRRDWESRLDADAGFAQKFLATLTPLVAHTVLISFTEAYRVVAEVLARKSATDALGEKDVLAQCLPYARQALLQRRITSEASIGKLLFLNGFKLMENRGLAEAGDEELVQRRLQMSQSLRELTHRIEILRSLALPR